MTPLAPRSESGDTLALVGKLISGTQVSPGSSAFQARPCHFKDPFPSSRSARRSSWSILHHQSRHGRRAVSEVSKWRTDVMVSYGNALVDLDALSHVSASITNLSGCERLQPCCCFSATHGCGLATITRSRADSSLTSLPGGGWGVGVPFRTHRW